MSWNRTKLNRNDCRFPIRTYLISCAVLLALLPFTAQAEESDDSWKWRASIYGWLSDVGGTVQFPSGEEGSINVEFEDILDKLDFVLMGAVDARKGSWGFFSDLIYLDLSDSVTNSREFSLGPDGQIPAGVDLTTEVDMKSLFWTVTGLYNFSYSERHSADFIFGARMADLKTTMDWSISGNIGDLELPGPSGSSKITQTIWDAVIGVKGYTFIGDGNWLIPYHLDIGTGDSDLTWQAMAGIGYQFRWGTMVLNYRYLEYDVKSGSAIQDLNMGGPLIGASFQW
jgi:hypothetical protein